VADLEAQTVNLRLLFIRSTTVRLSTLPAISLNPLLWAGLLVCPTKPTTVLQEQSYEIEQKPNYHFVFPKPQLISDR